MPYRLDVRCPECSGHAVFEFARIVRIALKGDVDYFKRAKCFDCKSFEDSSGRWHAAVFYHGLHSINEIRELPDGYSVEDFAHRRHWVQPSGGDIGGIVCSSCGVRRKAQLNWPDDAYYQCDIRGHNLWAFDRNSLIELKDFIQSSSRDTKAYVHEAFLRHIPSVFLDRKNRDAIVKSLNKMLA